MKTSQALALYLGNSLLHHGMLFLDERHSNDHELASREACDLALQPRTPSLARGSWGLEPLCSFLISKGRQQRAQSKTPLGTIG